MRLSILYFDKPRTFAYAKLRQFLAAALPPNTWQLEFVSKPEQVLEIAQKTAALVFLQPMSAQARFKLKEQGKGCSHKALACWHALCAPNSFKECIGTYWQGYAGTWICGVPHPYSVEFSARGLIARWIRGAYELMKGRTLPRRFNCVHNPPLERLFADGLCAPDIETVGFSDRITYFGIGDKDGGASWDWNAEVQAAVTRWLQTSRPKVGQNSIAYDMPILQRVCGVKAKGPLGDTMALRSAYVRQWAYGLQHIAAQIFMVEPWKACYRAGTAEEWYYNAQDAEATYWIADHYHRVMEIPLSCGLDGLTLL